MITGKCDFLLKKKSFSYGISLFLVIDFYDIFLSMLSIVELDLLSRIII